MIFFPLSRFTICQFYSSFSRGTCGRKIALHDQRSLNRNDSQHRWTASFAIRGLVLGSRWDLTASLAMLNANQNLFQSEYSSVVHGHTRELSIMISSCIHVFGSFRDAKQIEFRGSEFRNHSTGRISVFRLHNSFCLHITSALAWAAIISFPFCIIFHPSFRQTMNYEMFTAKFAVGEWLEFVFGISCIENIWAGLRMRFSQFSHCFGE